MFQTICIKPNESTYPTDIGFIAENLLYYQNVYIVAGTDTFPILINNCGIETLLELLTHRNLKILIKENHLGVVSQQANIEQTLTNVALFSSDSLSKEEVIFRDVFKVSGRHGYSKRITNKLAPLIETVKYENNICDLVREDLINIHYVKQAIIDTIRFYNPLFTLRPEEINYEFLKTSNGYIFQSRCRS